MLRAAFPLLLLGLLACGADPAGGAGGSGGTGGSSGAGGSGGSGGTLSCIDIFKCVDRCADPACQQQCVADGTESGRDAARAFSNCAIDHGCSSTDCPPCQDELDVCLGDGLTDLTCPRLQSCLEACAGDPTCEQQACLDRALPGAAGALAAFESCLAASGCGPTDTACITLNCEREYADCFGG